MVGLSPTDEARISGWHYADLDAQYDPGPGSVRATAGYLGLATGPEGLVGYVCFDGEARVSGLAPAHGVVDLAVGLRPDLVGGGWGHAVISTAVAEARRRFPGAHGARAVVHRWNHRSRRALRSAGFAETAQHTCDDGRVFVVHHRRFDGA